MRERREGNESENNERVEKGRRVRTERKGGRNNG